MLLKAIYSKFIILIHDFLIKSIVYFISFIDFNLNLNY